MDWTPWQDECKAEIKNMSSRELKQELQAVKDSRLKSAFTMGANGITAVFTTPATGGLAAVGHAVSHCIMQAKLSMSILKVSACKEELRERGIAT